MNYQILKVNIHLRALHCGGRSVCCGPPEVLTHMLHVVDCDTHLITITITHQTSEQAGDGVNKLHSKFHTLECFFLTPFPTFIIHIHGKRWSRRMEKVLETLVLPRIIQLCISSFTEKSLKGKMFFLKL